MTAFEQARLVLGAVGTAGFLLAACTSSVAPAASSPATQAAPAVQATTMESKDGAMEKTDAMESATAAMETGATTEKTQGTTDAAMMEKTDAMDPAKTAMESGATMEKTEGAMDTALMEKTDAMMTDQKESGAMPTQASTPPRRLPDQRLSPHFVVSSPKHGETLAQVPERIQINFDFTLHESSAIAVTKDGAPVQAGMIPVNPRGLVLAATLPQAGQGLYVVGYKACWPDRSCHDGQFAFTVQP